MGAPDEAHPVLRLLSPAMRKLRPRGTSASTSGPLPVLSYKELFMLLSAMLPISVRAKTEKFERCRKSSVMARSLCCSVSTYGSVGLPSSKLVRVRGQSNAQTTGAPEASR